MSSLFYNLLYFNCTDNNLCKVVPGKQEMSVAISGTSDALSSRMLRVFLKMMRIFSIF